MTDSKTYSAECFCGAVTVEVTGAPIAMGYCHCTDCRAWAAAPVNGFTLWPTGTMRVTQGEAFLGVFQKKERSHRTFCTKCGGHVMNDHPGDGFTDVYSSVLPELDFAPTLHIYYGESVLQIRDGLPKYRDLPTEYGGSGEEMAE